MNQPIREGFVDVSAQPAQPPASPQVVDISTGSSVTQLPTPEWPITVKLRHRPLRGNKGEELHQLIFREPTARDILNCGNPVWINSAGEILFDERKMTTLMAHLSGVLVPLLDTMHPQDWNSCAYRLRRFFLPDPEAW